jgi:hypothetical protein
MMVVSNGVRIATLMLLANYAIRSFYIGSYIARAELLFLARPAITAADLLTVEEGEGKVKSAKLSSITA